MTNQEIKELLKKENIFGWQLAKEIGISETTFSRWYREPFNDEKVKMILSAIDVIKGRRKKTHSI